MRKTNTYILLPVLIILFSFQARGQTQMDPNVISFGSGQEAILNFTTPSLTIENLAIEGTPLLPFPGNIIYNSFGHLFQIDGSPAITITSNKELNRTATFNADLLPYAYGNVFITGTNTVNFDDDTDNFSVTYNVLGGYFDITFLDEIASDITVHVSTNNLGGALDPVTQCSWNVLNSSTIRVTTFRPSGAVGTNRPGISFVAYKK